MTLLRLDAADFRNFASASLAPSPRLNFLIGANASGKTSLLEAIYLLGRGRSFRTVRSQHLIRTGQSALTVGGRLAGPGARPLGVKIQRGERELHLDGKVVGSSLELIRAFPVQVIHPASIELLEGAPKQRRQFLDWGAFHAEPTFLDPWRRYAKALTQRNLLLREQRAVDLPPWTHEVARYGKMVAASRSDYVARLNPLFSRVASVFLASGAFEIQIQNGWNSEDDLLETLNRDTAGDLRQGYTRAGPHKGEFALKVDGRPVRHLLSRGQAKLLVYALLLAQSELIEQNASATGCILIDDIASELDETHKARLLAYLGGRDIQCFVTATSRSLIEAGIDSSTAALFRVNQGHVQSE